MRPAHLLCLLLPAAALAAQPASEIAITVEGLRSNEGRIQCALYASGEGFPTRPEKALRTTTAPIVDRQGRCSFDGVQPGTYAVALFHDENANGKIDTNFLGIPREGLASSRDAKGFFGPPRFDDASFPYPGGEQRLVVHMKYL